MPALERFTTAQSESGSGFDAAMAELRAGRKRGHWIWYVFPQLAGLGVSSASQTYAISDRAEAVAYLLDPTLGSRLLLSTTVVAEQLRRGVPLDTLMASSIDARKLVSSLTLFGAVARDLMSEPGGELPASLVHVADEVLDRAAAQGYPACEFTRTQLGR